MVLGTLHEVDPPFFSTCLNASRSSLDASALQKAFPDSMAGILCHPHPSIIHSFIHLSIQSTSIPEFFLHSLSATSIPQVLGPVLDVEMSKMNRRAPAVRDRERQMSEWAVVYLGSWYPAKAPLNQGGACPSLQSFLSMLSSLCPLSIHYHCHGKKPPNSE